MSDERDHRNHGLIFGRGDDLGDEVVDPPMSRRMAPGPISGVLRRGIPFGEPPPEPVVLEGDIPWELRDDPSDEPKSH